MKTKREELDELLNQILQEGQTAKEAKKAISAGIAFRIVNNTPDGEDIEMKLHKLLRENDIIVFPEIKENFNTAYFVINLNKITPNIS